MALKASTVLLLGLVLLGALVRLLVLVPPIVASDEYWVGIAGLNILKGSFPFFLYGQPYLGSLDAYLQALALAVSPPTRWTLKIWPLIIAGLFVSLSYALGARLGDRRTAAFIGLAAACPAPLIVIRAVKEPLHYPLTPVLGLLLLVVAERLARSDQGGSPRTWIALGLVGGLSFWNNYLAVVYLGAVGCALLATRWRATLARGLRYGLPGFVLGSLPLWIYNIETGRPFVAPRGTWAPWTHWVQQFWWFLGRGLPALLGIPSWSAIASIVTLLLAGGAFVLGALRLLGRARRGEAMPAMILLVFTNMTLLLTTSVYGGAHGAEVLPERYVFPLATVIPVILGTGFGVIGRRRRLLAWLGAGTLAAMHLGLVLETQSAVLRPDPLGDVRRAQQAEDRMFRWLASQRLEHVYSEDYGVLNYLSGGRLVFSRTTREEAYPPFAELVDAARESALISPGPSPVLEAGLAALGARYEVHDIPPWRAYHRFSLPQVRYEEISPAAWSATGDDDPTGAAHAFDRDIHTLWQAPQRPGSTYVLDLGTPHPVGMVSWIPFTYRESPRGIEVAVSVDGEHWRPVARVAAYYHPVYWSGTHPFLRFRRPRVEIRFRETVARSVRLTQLGSDPRAEWSIRELFVYRPVHADRDPDPAGVDVLARTLAARGVTRVYGDHWVLARLRVMSRRALWVLPLTVPIDAHGRTDLYRRWTHPPDYRVLDRLRLTPTTAVVLERWVGTSEALEGLLHQAGYTFDREVHGEHVIYTRFLTPARPDNPLSRVGWRATASVAEGTAAQALDGDRRTRWTTVGVTPQTPGLWFAVDLGVPTPLGVIELDLGDPVHDYPRGLAAAVSLDGHEWKAVPVRVTWVGPLYWSGTHALRGGVERVLVEIPAASARFVRLEQTGHDGRFGWSIHELRIYPPRPGVGRQATTARWLADPGARPPAAPGEEPAPPVRVGRGKDATRRSVS